MASPPEPPAVAGELIAFADKLAGISGSVLRRYFRTPITIDTKADASPVTIADREAEESLRAAIEDSYPEHGIVGEELGRVRADAEFVWYLDPIDGTRSFLTGKPVFGTLIGLVHRGRPVLGVIDQPVTAERWLGALGQPTTLNGTPVRVRACGSAANAALYTTGPEWFAGAAREAFERLNHEVLMTLYSADCYAFGLLAAGFVDLVVEAGLQPYDYCAIIPVIEGAGGVISDWEGRPLRLDRGSNVLAAGDASVHRHVISSLAA